MLYSVHTRLSYDLFCAGGDIKTLYDARESKAAMKAAEQFFSTEYETDQLVHDYKKPIVAILDGIVMGGGVGLAYGASHRIVKIGRASCRERVETSAGAASVKEKRTGE